MPAPEERMPNFRRVAQALPELRKVYLRRIGLSAEQLFRSRASAKGFVKTGRMVRSIRHRLTATGLVVGSKARQAGVLNVGRSSTRTFTVEGKKRKDGTRGPQFERTYKPRGRGDFVTAALGQKALSQHEPDLMRAIEKAAFGG